MRVNVKNYMIRDYDRMLIIQTENDEVLYLYWPSGHMCIDDDTEVNRFRTYVIDVEYVEYYDNNNNLIKCDGIVEFVKGHRRLYEYPWIRHDRIPDDIFRKAGKTYRYWHNKNDRDVIEQDRLRRQWTDAVAFFSDISKSV